MLQKLMLKMGVLMMIGWLALAPAVAQAVDLGALIDLLQEKGVLTAEEASELRKRPMVEVPTAAPRQPVAASRDDGAVRLSASPSAMAQGPVVEPSVELPGWLQRFKIGGDIRLRYQADLFDEANNVATYYDPNDLSPINTTEDRQRFRYRARISLAAQVNDDLKAAFRLATGNGNDPVSTNDTLGDAFNKDGVVFDRAYLEWQPTSLLTVSGGRIPSPWFATDLVWDKDLNFEGLAVTYRQQYLDWLGGFATVGAFPVQELEQSEEDLWLYGGQVGVNVGRLDGISFRLAGAYYHFSNTEGQRDDAEITAFTDLEVEAALRSLQRNNTPVFKTLTGGETKVVGLAADFHELDLLATLDIGFWDPIHLVFLVNYVKNIGYDHDEVKERYGAALPYGNEDTAYMFGAALGHGKVDDWGRWSAYMYYKYLESDAVLASFTDSDFHLGGTDAKGWVAGAEFGLMKNTWLSAKWLSANEINEEEPFGVDILQIDLNAKF